MRACRLTWQGVALVLGTMAAAVAVLRAMFDRAAASDHAVVMMRAIDRGGRLDADGNIEMPGDAADGTYPGAEA